MVFRKHGNRHRINPPPQPPLQQHLALLDIHHHLRPKCIPLHPLPLPIPPPLHPLPPNLVRHAPPPRPITLPRHLPHGPRHNHKHDRLRLRPSLGPSNHNPRLDPMVDRRHNLSRNLLLSTFRNHAHPQHRIEKHDSRLASSRCRYNRCCSFRRYRSGYLTEPSARTLDTDNIIHPLGHRRTPRNDNPSHVLPTPHSPQITTTRSHRLCLPTPRSIRPRRLRYNAAREGSDENLPCHRHA